MVRGACLRVASRLRPVGNQRRVRANRYPRDQPLSAGSAIEADAFRGSERHAGLLVVGIYGNEAMPASLNCGDPVQGILSGKDVEGSSLQRIDEYFWIFSAKHLRHPVIIGIRIAAHSAAVFKFAA